MTFRILCEGDEFPEKSIQGLEKAMSGFVEADVPLAVELVFVDEMEIRRLNRETRDMDKVTDVLSYPTMDEIKGQALFSVEHPFEMDEEGNLLIGSIVVCCQRAKEQAEELGNSFVREVAFLAVHSTLHLLGYDHERSREEDELQCRLQKEIIETIGLE